MEINGNFEKGKPFAGALGGELMQIYLVLLELKAHGKKLPEPKPEEKKPQKHFHKEVINRVGLVNFFLNYIREMKHEILHIQVSQAAMALLDSFKVPIGDLSKLSE